MRATENHTYLLARTLICVIVMMLALTVCAKSPTLTPTPTRTVALTPTVAPPVSPTLSPTTVPATQPAVIRPQSHLSFAEALFVVMSADHNRLLAAYEGNSELQVLHQLPALERAQSPSFFPYISRDGVWVTTLEDDKLLSKCIYRVELGSLNEPRCIVSWSGFKYEASISADGKQVVFQAAEEECEGYRHGEPYGCLRHIYVMDSDGSDIRRITDKPSDFCHLEWSPNNIQLAYTELCSPVNERMRKVYVVTLEPYNLPKQVIQLTANGESGGWLPNGEWLEWLSPQYGPGFEHRLSRIGTDGKVVDEISLDYAGGWLPHGVWSPDSNKLTWITEESVIRVWNRERDEVTTAQLSEAQATWPVKWLPDGQRLVFRGYRIGTDGESADERSWFVVNVDGSGLVEYREPTP